MQAPHREAPREKEVGPAPLPTRSPTEAALGLEFYITGSEPLGGRLRALVEDFLVEEIPHPQRPRGMGSPGGFTVATIRVWNWETNRLIRAMARALHLSRWQVGFAGTKDRRAVTTQRFTFMAPPEAVAALRLNDVEVLDTATCSEPLRLGDLWGNSFDIRITGIPGGNETRAGEVGGALRACGGFPGYFGVQRFGSVRPITHLAGKSLSQGDFEGAVMHYIGHPFEGDEGADVRAYIEETRDFAGALARYPGGLGLERSVLEVLARHPPPASGPERPAAFVRALRALPHNLLLMFVHAYQGWLFNRILSRRMRIGLPLDRPVAGDLVVPFDAPGMAGPDRCVPVTDDNMEKVSRLAAQGRVAVSGLVFGSEPRFAGGAMGEIERAVVAEEGLVPNQFVIPEIPKLTTKGTRRELLCRPRDLEISTEPGAVRLRFKLVRGAYATCLAREFMKAEDVRDY